MTSLQLRQGSGLSCAELTCWIKQGLLVPERTGAGRNQEFRADQLERFRVLKALHAKGVRLSRPGATTAAKACGPCRDATAAIRAVVVRANRPCSAVDLNAIRMAEALE